MDLKEFLSGNDRIDVVEVISFPHIQPNFVVLRGPGGRVTHLTSSILEIEEKRELGILKSGDDGDPLKGQKDILPGGVVLSLHYLAAPGFDLISGIRMRLDAADLIVTAGDMPYSIFIKLGDTQRGRPEFPFDQYNSIDMA